MAAAEWKTASASQWELKNKGQVDNNFGNFDHVVYTKEGNSANASIFPHKSFSDWILDSGASKHVAGTLNEFDSYIQYPPEHNETIQTADGTPQPIKGVGTVQCTPCIKLSYVLHIPAFPVNLVSLSSLIDQLDCRITLDKYMCLIQGRQTCRKLGTGTRHNGLWYVNRGASRSSVLAAMLGERETMAIIHHCRMGHMSFEKMSSVS